MNPRSGRRGLLLLLGLAGGLVCGSPLAGQLRASDLAPGTAADSASGEQEPPTVDELAEWAASEEDGARLRQGIRAHVSEGAPTAATLWIQLLAVIESVELEWAPVAVRGVGLGVDAQGRAGADLILEALPDESVVEGQVSLLALAAHLTEGDDPAHAAEIRARLVEAHPDAPESPEARLLLARFYLRSDDRRAEGIRMLEALIIESPEHPVAPEARRLYEAGREREEPAGAGGGSP